MSKISIVIPCFNEEEALPVYYREMRRVMEEMSEEEFELLFVDDGSSDRTLPILKEMNETDARCRYLSFSRNFGKEAAIYAGLKNAEGDYVATMDVDMQDPPGLLPEMYRILKDEDYDSVATRRVSREGEPVIRSFFARKFYWMINRISDSDIVDGARDFRLMKKDMADAVVQIGEYNRFSKGIFGWVGFNTKWIDFENIERSTGETKWSFWKLFIYSIEGIVAFSTVPLAVVSVLGIIICILSFIGMIFIFVRAAIWGDPVNGWPSMICIITMLGGIQLLCLGIIGYYLSKTYLETKQRPIYIEKEKVVCGTFRKRKRRTALTAESAYYGLTLPSSRLLLNKFKSVRGIAADGYFLVCYGYSVEPRIV